MIITTATHYILQTYSSNSPKYTKLNNTKTTRLNFNLLAYQFSKSYLFNNVQKKGDSYLKKMI